MAKGKETSKGRKKKKTQTKKKTHEKKKTDTGSKKRKRDEKLTESSSNKRRRRAAKDDDVSMSGEPARLRASSSGCASASSQPDAAVALQLPFRVEDVHKWAGAQKKIGADDAAKLRDTEVTGEMLSWKARKLRRHSGVAKATSKFIEKQAWKAFVKEKQEVAARKRNLEKDKRDLEERKRDLEKRKRDLEKRKQELKEAVRGLHKKMEVAPTDFKVKDLKGPPSTLSVTALDSACLEIKAASCPAVLSALLCFHSGDKGEEEEDPEDLEDQNLDQDEDEDDEKDEEEVDGEVDEEEEKEEERNFKAEVEDARKKLEDLTTALKGGFVNLMKQERQERPTSGVIAALIRDAVDLPTVHQVSMRYKNAEKDGVCCADVGFLAGDWRDLEKAQLSAFLLLGRDEPEAQLPQAYGYALSAMQVNADIAAEEECNTVLAVIMCYNGYKWKVEVWAFSPILFKDCPKDTGEGKESHVEKSKADTEQILGYCLLFRGGLADLPRVVVGVRRFTRRWYGKARSLTHKRVAGRNVLIEEEGPGEEAETEKGAEEETSEQAEGDGMVTKVARKYAYKVYDYRRRADTYFGRMYVFRERTDLSLKHIPGARIMAREGGLTVLRYPYLEGDHVPTKASQMIGVLEKLQELRAARICHGDIRLYNMVFGREDSWLIDFDLGGEAGVARYPSGYNIEIHDGKRHPGASGCELLHLDHDVFSMAACMGLLECTAEEDQKKWGEVTGLVGAGHVGAALEKLEKIRDASLRRKQ